MKTYKLLGKKSNEVINKCYCLTLEQAVAYFSIVKELSKNDLLDIFRVVNN
jgi:hypothetical protein